MHMEVLCLVPMLTIVGKRKFDAYSDQDEINMERFNVENASGIFFVLWSFMSAILSSACSSSTQIQLEKFLCIVSTVF